MLQSFSMPFLMLREVALEQPIFGANYIKGKVIAEEGGKYLYICVQFVAVTQAGYSCSFISPQAIWFWNIKLA